MVGCSRFQEKVVEFMDNHTFKSVTFGGFDKQDVAAYIEQISREHAARTEALEKEREALQAENDTMRRQLTTLQTQAEEQGSLLAKLREELEQATARAQALSEEAARADALAAELAQLKPDAESYRQFRNRIGGIECEARSRAAELENNTKARLRKTAADFREKYRILAATFDTASTYVNGELRKVEVNLTQLPRALDQIGADLTELENLLKDGESK